MAAVLIKTFQTYEISNVIEAFTVINKLLESNENLGLTQVCKKTKYSKNKTYRLLLTLEQCGVIEKDLQGNYHIGVAAIGIAHKIIAKSSVLDTVRPLMKSLVKVFNEAVYFAHYSAGEAVLVEFNDCCHSVKVTSLIGATIPLSNNSELNISGQNIAKIGDITVDVGGVNPDVTTVSIPFDNYKGLEIGAIVVLAPTFRMSLDRIKAEIVPALRDVMQRHQLQQHNTTNKRFLSYAHSDERTYGEFSSLGVCRAY